MLAMHDIQPLSIPALTDRPRHAQQEVVDLLAAALLRLRTRHLHSVVDSEPVDLGFSGHQRVNANPDHFQGVRR